jgi:eukaryotic-like serine/threonine-protein kinase
LHPDTIAHYQVGEKLGQGGMGEVYRATDTKLGRAVAVKFLADSVANDATHMARFTREAHVLASLNHPNIAAIYGVEDRALIMELVEGQTLSDRIKAGAIPLEEALTIARQIADALEAAHAKGIVHRDLKPANIKITPDGTVKVLDFGIAKVAGIAAAPPEESPTIATTQAGLILGTAGYMAPEQARGKEVDKRADVWAFGVVLYEMLTGTQLFQGDTVTDVMAAVVRQDPDWSRVPAKVRPLLQRCLDKDPKRRLRDIGDAMLLLDLATATEGSAGTAPARPAAALWLAVCTAAVSLLALAVLAFVHFRETPPVAETIRFPLDFGADLSPIGSLAFAVSPDGRNVAYGAFGADGVPRIWLRPLGALTTRLLPGSEIDRNSQALFWSPDSRFLAYWSDRKLKRIDISGGPAQTIADAPNVVFGGSWNRDGVIVFATRAGLLQVAATGGTPTPLTMAGENEVHILPHFLPDGRHFLYVRGGDTLRRNVHVGSLDAQPGEPAGTPLLASDSSVSYAPGPDPELGQLLFVRDKTLLAQPFDARRRQLGGEPAVMAEEVTGNASASNTGALVYFTLSAPGIQLTWFNRSGQPAGTPGEPGPYSTIKVSPDGTRAAVVRFDETNTNNPDIWQIDLTSGTITRFTFDAASDTQPVWSADGTRIAWISQRGGFVGFYSKLADGSGSDELLYRSAGGPTPTNLTDWTRDGRFLIYNQASDIWAVPVTEGAVEDRKAIPLVQSEGAQLGAYVSPDLRWMAYMSNESGRQDLFVQPFAPAANGSGQRTPATGKWMVSNGTLGMARWRADGRELLFVGTDGGVMAVDVAPDPVFKASPPKLLFQLPRAILTRTGTPGSIVDVSRDHQRFLLSMLSADISSGLKVVLNWQSGLKGAG